MSYWDFLSIELRRDEKNWPGLSIKLSAVKSKFWLSSLLSLQSSYSSLLSAPLLYCWFGFFFLRILLFWSSLSVSLDPYSSTTSEGNTASFFSSSWSPYFLWRSSTWLSYSIWNNVLATLPSPTSASSNCWSKADNSCWLSGVFGILPPASSLSLRSESFLPVIFYGDYYSIVIAFGFFFNSCFLPLENSKAHFLQLNF